MDFKFQRRRVNTISETKIIEELKKAAKHFNYIEFGWRDFDKVSEISHHPVVRRFGTWKKSLEALRDHLKIKGLLFKPRPFAPNRVYSDKELFDEMEMVWNQIGQRPSRYEWELSKPKIAYGTYKRRFGGWTKACLKFIEYKMGTNILTDDFVLSDKDVISSKNKEEIKYDSALVRNVSLSLRLNVLSRDNFRCVYCGKSPATDIGIRLHIDHITPFSKGGKSELNNLQTLCEECNLGKSDKKIK